MVVGYTTGVFDLFHIGHVNLLRNAKGLCDRLIVGVTIDELVRYKGKMPVIPYVERSEVVRACRYSDSVIPQTNLDKVEAYKRLKFNVLFVGDDWYGAGSWAEAEQTLKSFGVEIVYFPYTGGTSSTLINKTLEGLRANAIEK